jgi:hypothetical protein
MSQSVVDDPNRSSAARRYQLIALLALLLIFVVLLESGEEMMSLIVLLLGAVAIAFRWAIGPALVLLLLMLSLTDWRQLFRNLERLISPRASRLFYWDGMTGATPLTEVVLAMAVLAFVIAQYRLLSLTRNAFPPDGRRPTPGPGPAPPPQLRDARLLEENEIAFLAVTLPLWTGIAFFFWFAMSLYRVDWFGLTPEAWRILLTIWLAGAGLIGTRAIVGYLGLRRATEAEARLYLQDQIWRQTRREQARIDHWLTRARMRAQQREEGT